MSFVFILGSVTLMNIFGKFGITFPFKGRIKKVSAEVSEFGAYKVLEIGKKTLQLNRINTTGNQGGDIPEKPLTVNLEFISTPFKAQLIKEVNADGGFYHLRFIDISEGQRKTLRKHITNFGYPAPWERKFPRLSAKIHDDNVVVPCFANAVFNGEHATLEILNFTIDGFLLESTSLEEFSGVDYDHRIEFDILMSNGSSIEGFIGKVVRKTEVYSFTKKSKVGLFGICVESVNEESKRRYFNYIKKYCQFLQVSKNATDGKKYKKSA